jgi:hypothetical protein
LNNVLLKTWGGLIASLVATLMSRPMEALMPYKGDVAVKQIHPRQTQKIYRGEGFPVLPFLDQLTCFPLVN